MDDPSESPETATANPYASPRPVDPPPDREGPPAVPWAAQLVGWLNLVVSLPGAVMTYQCVRAVVGFAPEAIAAIMDGSSDISLDFAIMAAAVFVAVIWTVLEILLIGSGVELLRGRSRGQTLALWWAWLSLVNQILTYLWGLGVTWWGNHLLPGTFVGGGFGFRIVDALPLLYPAFVLFVMYQSSVTDGLDEREDYFRRRRTS